MTEDSKVTITAAQLAHLGEGALAYMREMDSDDLQAKFPGMPELESGQKLWAVFAANGRPILLTDARETAIAGVFQNELTPVSVH